VDRQPADPPGPLPAGRARKCFFQKHDAGSFGSHVHHVGIKEKDGTEEPYLFIDDAFGLMACVQMGTIEFTDGDRPSRMSRRGLVFDLDPDEGLDFAAVRAAAFRFRDLLKQVGLVTFPMVTGGKGVHVIAPLMPRAEWPEVKDFARRFAMAVARSDPDRFTAALPKAQRKGRIFVDYLRNQRGATASCPMACGFAPRRRWQLRSPGRRWRRSTGRRTGTLAMPPNW
jgi:bifunctional non-homologous end joining protein LigD